VKAAVRTLIAACLGWDEKFPNHRRLIRVLEFCREQSNRGQAVERQQELQDVLAEWADQLPSKHKVAPLSPGQLYAVMLAPAMSTGTNSSGSGKVTSASVDWPSVLTKAALSALEVPKEKARSPGGGTGLGNAAHQDLYDSDPLKRNPRP
jgi:hypothetical protein